MLTSHLLNEYDDDDVDENVCQQSWLQVHSNAELAVSSPAVAETHAGAHCTYIPTEGWPG